MAHVLGLFTCESAGERMESCDRVVAIANVGLSRDRYATGRGAYSHIRPQKVRHVTLIAQEDIDAANNDLKTMGLLPFEPFETRRNILVEGVDLLALVERRFTVGPVLFEGTEPADPCLRPSMLARKKGFPQGFAGRGGLRARVLTDGIIRLGDLLFV